MPLVHPAILGLTAASATREAEDPPPAAPTPVPARPRLGGPPTGGLPRDLLPAGLADAVLRDDDGALDLATLGDLAGRFAAASWLWRPIVRHDQGRRWYTRLLLTGVVEVWLIGWTPGQHTAVHDHGGALGALAVADGAVEEDIHDLSRGSWQGIETRRHTRGHVVGFAADHVHRIINRDGLAATTVHVYSPPELPLRYEPSGAARIPAAAPVPPAVTAATAGAAAL
ncbi:cysteine dioxygenase [Pseudofrankia asymbiotica]|uniref:cysteine dioxygenase n=1 Tax=Pseudofrankia asymbiotica TaxID=1834516 RepID=UPI00097611CB|nr:cysteine dioxygenase family protein [Pseudofrankia asymbiotica]